MANEGTLAVNQDAWNFMELSLQRHRDTYIDFDNRLVQGIIPK